MDLSTLDGASDFVLQGMLPLMRVNLERDGYLAPVAVIFATLVDGQKVPPTPIFVPIDMPEPEARELVAAAIRELAQRMEAVGVMFFSEGWAAPLPEGAVARYGYAPASPERKEVVMITLDHEQGRRIWMVPIKRNGKPSLGEPEDGGEPGEGSVFGRLRRNAPKALRQPWRTDS